MWLLENLRLPLYFCWVALMYINIYNRNVKTIIRAKYLDLEITCVKVMVDVMKLD